MTNIILNAIIALVGVAIFAPDSDILVTLSVGVASIASVRFFIHVMRDK